MTDASVPDPRHPSDAPDVREYPTMAIWALVLSCVGILMPFVGVAGLGLGLMVLRDERRLVGPGRRIATAAVIIGAIDLVVLVALVLLLLVLVAAG